MGYNGVSHGRDKQVGVNFRIFIGPHICYKCCCTFQETEPREIIVICKNLILDLCKIDMFKIYMYKLFASQSQLLTTGTVKPFENTMRKGENAGYQYFLLCSQCFLLFQC